jgi:hypothetical protein
METIQATTLQLPSFLHGSHIAIKRKTKAEGRRCASHYQLNSSLPQPRELLAVAPDDVVFTHSAADLQDEQPAWRLYMVSEVMMTLCERHEKKHRHLDDMYEASFRETAWGALYFVLSGRAPESAERTALRLGAVLRFWDSLQHGRYSHQKPKTLLNLEELLTTACGWAMDAWCPEEGGTVRSRLELASERMARATGEDCIEAILRALPHILPLADRKKLNHPEVVTHLASWREYLTTLDATEFERISGVSPSEVLRCLYRWDRQLDVH